MGQVRRLGVVLSIFAAALGAVSGCAGGGTTVQPAGTTSSAPTSRGTPDTEVTPVPANVIVQVDIFSGRPSPSWTLDEADSSQVRRHLDELEQTDAPSPTPGLGFRGFVLTGVDPSALAPYDWVVVQGTSVVAHTGGREVTLADPDHALYSLVRGRTESHVEPAIFAHIPEAGIG
jgi:hypothetical protein